MSQLMHAVRVVTFSEQLGCGDNGYTYIFFFQAEDGIRDYKVTGVQTCALPISSEKLQNKIIK